MDRWTDADDDIAVRARGPPQGRVARLGMTGFVKAEGSMGTENAQTMGKVEVVQPKREQRKAEATRLMPPPQLPTPTAPAAPSQTAPILPPPPATAPSGPLKLPAPDWASQPPSGSRLLVYKDGHVIQEISLAKLVTVFGRVEPLCDVVLDHPSVSRQHATAAFHAARGAWLITDLGSTHGTFVGGRQLGKNDPMELPPGEELRFAASTRRYKLPPGPSGPNQQQQQQQQQGAGTAAKTGAGGGDAADMREAAEMGTGAAARDGVAGLMPPPPPKRPRVCFADDMPAGGSTNSNGGGGGGGSSSNTCSISPAAAAAGDPAPKPLASRPPLETVIGFSDGRDFTARVGPRAAAGGVAEGRFAGAVASTTIVMVSPRHGSGSSGSGSSGSSGHAAAAAGAAASTDAAAGGSHGGGLRCGGGGGSRGESGSDGGEGRTAAACGMGSPRRRTPLPALGSPRGAVAAATAAAAAGGEQHVSSGSGGGVAGGGVAGGGVAVAVRPRLVRDVVERLRQEAPPGGGGSLYEQLPPPSSK